MELRKKDGIVINANIYCEDDKKADLSIFLRIMQLLAIILGCWSFLFVFIESFSIYANVYQVNIMLTISSIVFFLFFLFPYYGVVKAFFAILFYVLFCYSRFPRLQNAFYILENLVILKINKYYETQILLYKADYTSAEADMSLLLSVIIIPITALLANALVKKRMRSLAYILLMLPIIASFLIGVVPAQEHIIIILLVLIFISKVHGNAFIGEGRFPSQLKTRVGMKVATLLCGICLFLFFILKLFVTPMEYENIQEIKTMKSKIQTALYEFSIEDVTDSFSKFKISNTKVAAGGLSGGQLGEVDQVSFTDTEHLRITVPFPSAYEGIYLKGYVGSLYTGNSWEEGNEDMEMKYQSLLEKIPLERFSPINQVSLLLERMAQFMDVSYNQMDMEYQYYQGNIAITYKDANRSYLYIPYFSKLNSLEAIDYKQDLYAIPKVKSDIYDLKYYFNISFDKGSTKLIDANLSEIFTDYHEYEKLYREFVYDVYTQLPEAGLDRLKKEFMQLNSEKDLDSLSAKIEYVKEYLNNRTEYSLSPGKLPKGQDFVEYFLYENSIGYCAHYASAATLMLRAMGVPARYVEGYAVGQNEIIQSNSQTEQRIVEYSNSTDNTYVVRQVELSVKDYNAHAWVEVYIDNCGWIPVEFTPGSALEYTDTIVSSMTQIGEGMKQDEEQNVPTITPKAPSPTPIEQREDRDIEPTTSPDMGNASSNNKEKVDEEIATNRTVNKFLMVAIGTILGFGTVGIIVPVKLKKNRIRKSNRNQKALILYKEIERIISLKSGLLRRDELLEDHLDYVKKNHPYINEEDFARCIEIIQRARFGRESISAEDLDKVLGFYEDLFEKTYENSPFSRKLYLKLQLLF